MRRYPQIRTQAESGIVFLDPPHMQFCIYTTLKSRWIERRDMLRNSIELMAAKSSKSMEEYAAEAEKFKRLNESLEGRALREAEEKRQEALNARMAAEEEYCRKFYREEFLFNLRERRMMAQEERNMRLYIGMLKRLEDLKNKVQPGEKMPKGMTRNELRRLELKKGAADKIREEKEGLLMIAEDELSFKMRAYYKMLEQRQKLLDEGGMVQDDSDDDEDSVMIDPEEDMEVIPNIPPRLEELSQAEQEVMLLVGHAVPTNPRTPVRVSPNSHAQDGKTPREVETAVKERNRQIRKRRKRVRVMVESNRRRKAAERSASAKWNAMYEASTVKSMKAELAWMEAEEEYRVRVGSLTSLLAVSSHSLRLVGVTEHGV
jgi:hypothetical protein